MTRTRLDVAVSVLVGVIVLIGIGAAWQTYRQAQAHGQMMGHSTVVHGPHPVWILFGTLLVAGAIGGIYWLVRDQVRDDGDRTTPRADPANRHDENDAAASQPDDEPSAASAAGVRSSVLDVLPEDERRILEPVIDSPGLTQIALRDRADFSKSKVSQTVTDLEKRGLLYREPQGRTYRVYPADDLDER
ncbi:helix-turn-helix transcriptional regulator [Halovivax gelatinilyticus]|uniref:helix-turn-helix transcriptional regulator n=1 Tax=Halovivax gelatinilyticus TaxID=2961597 RepID=UPI0020CA916E|nr:MarR family transcriptional regulator [Halovivax gelatinilyticus]